MRYCPGLAKKPTKAPSEKASDDKADDKPKDPFAPPYVPSLYVAEDTIKEDEDDTGDSFVVLVSRALVHAVEDAIVASVATLHRAELR